jgi:hypothetical protein
LCITTVIIVCESTITFVKAAFSGLTDTGLCAIIYSDGDSDSGGNGRERRYEMALRDEQLLNLRIYNGEGDAVPVEDVFGYMLNELSLSPEKYTLGGKLSFWPLSEVAVEAFDIAGPDGYILSAAVILAKEAIARCTCIEHV